MWFHTRIGLSGELLASRGVAEFRSADSHSSWMGVGLPANRSHVGWASSGPRWRSGRGGDAPRAAEMAEYSLSLSPSLPLSLSPSLPLSLSLSSSLYTSTTPNRHPHSKHLTQTSPPPPQHPAIPTGSPNLRGVLNGMWRHRVGGREDPRRAMQREWAQSERRHSQAQAQQTEWAGQTKPQARRHRTSRRYGDRLRGRLWVGWAVALRLSSFSLFSLLSLLPLFSLVGNKSRVHFGGGRRERAYRYMRVGGSRYCLFCLVISGFVGSK
jgi:hypothetical protein